MGRLSVIIVSTWLEVVHATKSQKVSNVITVLLIWYRFPVGRFFLSIRFVNDLHSQIGVLLQPTIHFGFSLCMFRHAVCSNDLRSCRAIPARPLSLESVPLLSR